MLSKFYLAAAVAAAGYLYTVARKPTPPPSKEVLVYFLVSIRVFKKKFTMSFPGFEQ